MTQPQLQIFLRSGEALTVEEIFEGFVLLAGHEASFPMLSRDDWLKACIALAFEAVDALGAEG